MFPIFVQVVPPSMDDSQFNIVPVKPVSEINPELMFEQYVVAPDVVPPIDWAFSFEKPKQKNMINKLDFVKYFIILFSFNSVNLTKSLLIKFNELKRN